MERRQFLLNAVEASLLAFLPAQGAFAAKKATGVAAPEGLLPAFNPVSVYVQSYVPPVGAIDSERAQSFRFDVVGWNTDKGRQNVTSPELGHVIVTRHPAEDEVRYEVQVDNGESETLRGSFRCRKDAFRTLTAWDYTNSLTAANPEVTAWTQTHCSGSCVRNEVVQTIDGATSTTAIDSPLLCRWGLLDAPACFAGLCADAQSFGVLDVPSGLRKTQRFVEDRHGHLPGGEASPIRTYLQTGPGTLPTHWIVDEVGRPLFVTSFLTSWALKAVD